MSALNGFPVISRIWHMPSIALESTMVGYPMLSARECALLKYSRPRTKSDLALEKWVPTIRLVRN
jgi:hypothetical protein